MIEARGLTKRYGKLTAVDGVNLSVGPRGVVGFLGPNGAGKTTTMRMLTGYLAMTEGSAVVCGHDVFEDPIAVKQRVGYLPETPPLYPELSVGEYLSFVAEIRGVASAKRLGAIGDAMERVGLRGFERRLVGSLSKGYRQRVGLAQAIVHNPPLIVLDEPTSGLDPAQLVGVRALIREIGQDHAVLLSTHVLQEVDALCERVVVVHRGKVAGDGTVDSLAEAAGAGPWLEVAVAGDGAELGAVISRLDGVVRVEPLAEADGVARWKVQGARSMTPTIAAAVSARGGRLHALAWHRASLEDVFLGLVGREAA